MSRIYFDSNVYSNLRNNTTALYRELNDLLKIYKDNLTFFFSHAHIKDKKKDLSDYKFLDFAFIETFTKDNYLSYHALEGNSSHYLATPLMVFNDEKETIDGVPSLFAFFEVAESDSQEIKSLKQAMQSVLKFPLPINTNLLDRASFEERNIISAIVPIDNAIISLADIYERMGNFYKKFSQDSQFYKDLRKVVDLGINNGKYVLTAEGNLDFNEALKYSTLKKSFIEFVKNYTSKNKNGDQEYYNFYNQAYQLLDVLGIKKDKITSKNNFSNLLNDGLHSYYARYCDFLITADDGLRVKSNGLYTLFGVHTIILSVEEFIAQLPIIGKLTDENRSSFIEKLVNDIENTQRANTNVDEDGREQSHLLINHRYFNFFDVIHEVKEKGFTHYFLRKIPKHYLTSPNYREEGQIIDRCIDLFDLDLEKKGYFNFDLEVEDSNEGERIGRSWRLGDFLLSLGRHEGLKEFCLLISPIGSLTLDNN